MTITTARYEVTFPERGRVRFDLVDGTDLLGLDGYAARCLSRDIAVDNARRNARSRGLAFRYTHHIDGVELRVAG